METISELMLSRVYGYYRSIVVMSDSLSPNIPVALTIAGSDSGGGAGIQADLMTFASLEVYATSAITCTTAQNPDGVISVQALNPDHVRDQITQVLEYFDVRAIKTGMLYNEPIIKAVASALEKYPDIPLVLDPVMVATSGAVLLEPEAIETLKTLMFPRASVITPNLDEASVLTGIETTDEATMLEVGNKLIQEFGRTFLLKGGHLIHQELTDLLVFPDDEPKRFTSSKIDGVNSHGSGCTLASAIAAYLAKGDSVADAVRKAHHYLQFAFRNPVRLKEVYFLNHFA